MSFHYTNKCPWHHSQQGPLPIGRSRVGCEGHGPYSPVLHPALALAADRCDLGYTVFQCKLLQDRELPCSDATALAFAEAPCQGEGEDRG